jgi:hypothetical protein
VLGWDDNLILDNNIIAWGRMEFREMGVVHLQIIHNENDECATRKVIFIQLAFCSILRKQTCQLEVLVVGIGMGCVVQLLVHRINNMLMNRCVSLSPRRTYEYNRTIIIIITTLPVPISLHANKSFPSIAQFGNEFLCD